MLNLFHNKHDNISLGKEKHVAKFSFLMKWSHISTNKKRTNKGREGEKDKKRKLEKKKVKEKNKEKLKERERKKESEIKNHLPQQEH